MYILKCIDSNNFSDFSDFSDFSTTLVTPNFFLEVEVWDLKKLDFSTKLKTTPFGTIMCTISISLHLNVVRPKFQCWTTYFIVFDAVVVHCSFNKRNICIFLEFWHLWIFRWTAINDIYVLLFVVIMSYRYKYQNW